MRAPTTVALPSMRLQDMQDCSNVGVRPRSTIGVTSIFFISSRPSLLGWTTPACVRMSLHEYTVATVWVNNVALNDLSAVIWTSCAQHTSAISLYGFFFTRVSLSAPGANEEVLAPLECASAPRTEFPPSGLPEDSASTSDPSAKKVSAIPTWYLPLPSRRARGFPQLVRVLRMEPLAVLFLLSTEVSDATFKDSFPCWMTREFLLKATNRNIRAQRYYVMREFFA